MEYKEFVKELGKLGKRPEADDKTLARYSYEQMTSDFPLIEPEFGVQSVRALSKFIREHNADFPVAPSRKVVSNIVQFSKANSVPEIRSTELCRSLVFLACDWILDPTTRPHSNTFTSDSEAKAEATAETTLTKKKIKKEQFEAKDETLETLEGLEEEDEDCFLPFEDEAGECIFDVSSEECECEGPESLESFTCFILSESSTLDALYNEKSSDPEQEKQDFDAMVARVVHLLGVLSRAGPGNNNNNSSNNSSELGKFMGVMRPLIHLVCNSAKCVSTPEKVLGELIGTLTEHAPFYAVLALAKVSRQPACLTFVSGHISDIYTRLEKHAEVSSEELEHIGEFITNYCDAGGAPSLCKSHVISAAFSAAAALGGKPAALLKAAVYACSYYFAAFEEQYAVVKTVIPTEDRHVRLAWEVMCSCYKKEGFPGDAAVVSRLGELSDISGAHWLDFEMSVEYLHRMCLHWARNFALSKRMAVFLEDFLTNKCVVTTTTATTDTLGMPPHSSAITGNGGGSGFGFVDDDDDVLNSLMGASSSLNGTGQLGTFDERSFTPRVTDDAVKRSSHLAEIKKLLTTILHKMKSD